MPWLSPKISHHPPPALRRCRDLGSVPEADQATGAVSPMLLCPILDIKWQDNVSNAEVLKRANLPSTEFILFQVQLRWAGNVKRMKDTCMLKAVFFSELQEGKRDRNAPRKRYKDQLKRQFAQAEISHESRQQEALDRDSWRSSVRKASWEFESDWHKAGKEIRRRQKGRAASLPFSSHTFVCPKCGRGCASRIGLYSHQRACKN